MNPLFSHPLPPRRPRNLVMAPQEPDKAGLAAMLAETRSKVWPVNEMHKVVDERRPQGYPIAPLDPLGEPTNFSGPGFVGPVPGPERYVLPNVMRRSTVEGMVAPEDPVSEEEYRVLLNRLRAMAGKNGPWN